MSSLVKAGEKIEAKDQPAQRRLWKTPRIIEATVAESETNIPPFGQDSFDYES